MAQNTGNGSIGPSHRQVLKLLAGALQGRAEPSFIAQHTVVLLDLADAGYVDVQVETVRKEGREAKTVRVRITAAGRRAIKE
jgi:hypothetical protein